MFPMDSEAGRHIFTPVVLQTPDWCSQVVLRNLSAEDLVVQLTTYMPDSKGQISQQRTITLAGNGYFKKDNLMRFMRDPLAYALLSAEVVQGTGSISGCARQVSAEHTGAVYPFWKTDSGKHQAVLPYVCDTADFRSSMGLCNTSSQEITITASLVSAGSVVDQQAYQLAPMSYLAVADVAGTFAKTGKYSGTQGYVRLTSAHAFHAIGGIIDRQTNDPCVYGDAAPFTSGFTPLIIRNPVWRTCLFLANDTADTANVMLSLYEDGQHSADLPVCVPAMSVLCLEDVMSLFHTERECGTLFISSVTPVYAIVQQRTCQGTGGVYPIFRQE